MRQDQIANISVLSWKLLTEGAVGELPRTRMKVPSAARVRLLRLTGSPAVSIVGPGGTGTAVVSGTVVFSAIRDAVVVERAEEDVVGC